MNEPAVDTASQLRLYGFPGEGNELFGGSSTPRFSEGVQTAGYRNQISKHKIQAAHVLQPVSCKLTMINTDKIDGPSRGKPRVGPLSVPQRISLSEANLVNDLSSLHNILSTVPPPSSRIMKVLPGF
jgi:hypothetical protein